MCLYPRLIKNRKYIANKKNGGNIPPVSDLRVLMVPSHDMEGALNVRNKRVESGA